MSLVNPVWKVLNLSRIASSIPINARLKARVINSVEIENLLLTRLVTTVFIKRSLAEPLRLDVTFRELSPRDSLCRDWIRSNSSGVLCLLLIIVEQI